MSDRPQLSVELHRCKVRLEMTFASHHDAAQWYDELISKAREGMFTLSMEIEQGEVAPCDAASTIAGEAPWTTRA